MGIHPSRRLKNYFYKDTIQLLNSRIQSTTLFVDVEGHPAAHTSEYVLNPYTEQRMWVFYRSGIVTMTNMLRAPIVLRDINGKRKSLQIAVPRNMEQIQLYREAAMRW